jgi:hypothetical protein
MAMTRRIGSGVAFGALVLAAAYAVTPNPAVSADSVSLLAGKVTSTTGEALVGIPIKAHKGTMTVAVYSDAKGEYSFPSWSDLTRDPMRSVSSCRISSRSRRTR